MVDSHAHIIDEFYSDIDTLIKEIKDKGVVAVINCADSLETTKEVLLHSNKYNNFLMPTVGIHPQNISGLNIEVLSEIEQLLIHNKFVAVGEIGLDYSRKDTDKSMQKLFFIKQVEIAEKFNLPIIVHSRDAIQDTYDILKAYNCKGIIHCFSGSVEMAKEFVKLGYYLGIGGVITFKNSKLYEVVETISIDNLLLETDSPFLTPEPLRGLKNNPANIKFVAMAISKIKNLPFEEVVTRTTKNAINVFDLNI